MGNSKETVELTYRELEFIINVVGSLNSSSIDDMGKALQYVAFSEELLSKFNVFSKTIDPYRLTEQESLILNNIEVAQKVSNEDPEAFDSFNKKMFKINEAYSLKVSIEKIDFSILPKPHTIRDLQILMKICKGSVKEIIEEYNAKLNKNEK